MRIVRLDVEIQLLKELQKLKAQKNADEQLRKLLDETYATAKKERDYFDYYLGKNADIGAFVQLQRVADAHSNVFKAALELPVKPQDKIEKLLECLDAVKTVEKIMVSRQEAGVRDSYPDLMQIRYVHLDMEIQFLKVQLKRKAQKNAEKQLRKLQDEKNATANKELDYFDRLLKMGGGVRDFGAILQRLNQTENRVFQAEMELLEPKERIEKLQKRYENTKKVEDFMAQRAKSATKDSFPDLMQIRYARLDLQIQLLQEQRKLKESKDDKGALKYQSMDEYFAAADKAFMDGKGLIVLVGFGNAKLERDLSDFTQLRVAKFPGVGRMGIVVGVPNEKWLTRYDFPPNMSAAVVRQVLTPKKK
jgi:hypothetical protein